MTFSKFIFLIGLSLTLTLPQGAAAQALNDYSVDGGHDLGKPLSPMEQMAMIDLPNKQRELERLETAAKNAQDPEEKEFLNQGAEAARREIRMMKAKITTSL